ncbi:hypothetical protein F5Y00DRAFT_252593 [Daldinia vernicosa]|uniref:uncharacterized protein n=1 Tax=Daldinia vernicosa TaxID=114800 RepID=UPI0020076A66|nr:uncharacterized protein F5Y00DRAFT_252593 [Daldinia vernicosa]KAI0849945.1 hypothetical protein F5Y00DRAFT_252593 [Daldinia vernicosa]
MELFNPVDYSKDWDGGCFVIGIDMGTTYSGVSYSFHKNGLPSDQIVPTTFRLWPGPASWDNKDIKIPSKISYDANGSISWGLETEGKQRIISWFKMLLVDDDDLRPEFQDSEYIQEAKFTMDALGKNPTQVVADFLGKIFEYVVVYMGQEKGDDFVEKKPFHVIITVPAIWRGGPLQRMREALKLSGILRSRRNQVPQTTYRFVTEPEAAALATVPELNKWDTLLPGTSFVIADLGGGTADCISYVVNSTEPFELREIVEGDGALCGGVFLHQSFNMAMKKKALEQEGQNWDEFHQLEKEKIIGIWECFTRGTYKTELDGTLSIKLGSRIGSHQGPDVIFNFSRDEICSIFQVVMPTIEALIERQVNAIKEKTLRFPKAIVLVGGLGQCSYIFEALKRRYYDKVPVIQEKGEKPRAAVSKGAVLCGTKGRVLIRSRIARYSYGYFLSKPFQEGIHNAEDRFHDTARNCDMARGQMEWLVKRGDNIDTQAKKVRQYDLRFSHRARGVQTSTEMIYESRSAQPSDRKAELWVEDGFQMATQITIRTPCPVEQLPKVKEGGV